MFKEFKEFINRGNAVEMAVGLVMGAAFKAIVDSLVADIIMPLIGLLVGDMSLSDLKYVFKPAVMEAGEVIKPELALRYGNLIQMIINFILIAFCIFLMVKGINKLHRKAEAEPEPEEKPDDIALLEEIRDLLSEK